MTTLRLTKNDIETMMNLVEDPAANFKLLFKLFLMKKEFEDTDFTLGKSEIEVVDIFEKEFLFPSIRTKMFGLTA